WPHVQDLAPAGDGLRGDPKPVRDSLRGLAADGLGEGAVDNDGPRSRGFLPFLAGGPGDRRIGQTAQDHVAPQLAEGVVAVLEDRRPVRAEQQAEAVIVGHGHTDTREKSDRSALSAMGQAAVKEVPAPRGPSQLLLSYCLIFVSLSCHGRSVRVGSLLTHRPAAPTRTQGARWSLPACAGAFSPCSWLRAASTCS